MRFKKKLTHADFRNLVNGEEISIKLPTGDYVDFILEDMGFNIMQLELNAAVLKQFKELHKE